MKSWRSFAAKMAVSRNMGFSRIVGGRRVWTHVPLVSWDRGVRWLTFVGLCRTVVFPTCFQLMQALIPYTDFYDTYRILPSRLFCAWPVTSSCKLNPVHRLAQQISGDTVSASGAQVVEGGCGRSPYGGKHHPGDSQNGAQDTRHT